MFTEFWKWFVALLPSNGAEQMSLAAMKWKRVSVHKVVIAVLIAERDKGVRDILVAGRHVSLAELSSLLDAAKLTNRQQNHRRLRLLCLLKGPYVVELPPDTKWYEVRHLTDNELPELHVGAHIGWDDPLGKDKNELLKVAARVRYELCKPPSEWGPIVLWGHKKTGPFTIAEGNHRLIAYASTEGGSLNTPVFVGLSRMLFYFHIHDECGVVANDLFRR